MSLFLSPQSFSTAFSSLKVSSKVLCLAGDIAAAIRRVIDVILRLPQLSGEFFSAIP